MLQYWLTDELPESPVTLPPEDPGEHQRQQPRGELDQPQQHQHHHLRARQVHHWSLVTGEPCLEIGEMQLNIRFLKNCGYEMVWEGIESLVSFHDGSFEFLTHLIPYNKYPKKYG